jgi:hypothetical protein
MRKIALFVALTMIAASPATAAQKKAKRTAEPAVPAWQQQNENSYRLVRDSLPMWLPSWAQPIYHGMKKNEAEAAPQPAKKTKRKAKAG